jgi:hypothetical protein
MMSWSDEIAARWRQSLVDQGRRPRHLIIPADEAEAALDEIDRLQTEIDDAADEEQ